MYPFKILNKKKYALCFFNALKDLQVAYFKRIYILDEPTSNLDSISEYKIYDMIKIKHVL